MPWFSKRSSTILPTSTSFWEWWNAEGAALAEAAIEAADFGEVADAISAKVSAVSPDLDWELSAGTESQHRLTVNAGGVGAARPAAERWLRGAPAPTAVWEYSGSRQRASTVSSTRLRYDGVDVAFDQAIVAVDFNADRIRYNVTVYHPAFAELAPRHHMRVAFLFLDSVLGEDDVERWIGEIAVSATRPASGVDPAALAATVDSLAERSPGEWALTHLPGPRLHMVRLRRPLHRVDFPLFDRHSAVRVAFSTTSKHGGPDDAAFETLSVLEDELIEAVGSAAGLFVIETTPRRRTFHLYSDAEDAGIEHVITQWAARSPRTTVTHSLDPAWGGIREYL